MIRRPQRPSFSPTDQPHLLDALKEARSWTSKFSAAQPFNSLLYVRCQDVMGTIDALAGEITGDRKLFHAPAHGSSNVYPPKDSS
jgi:hypothetical protein